MITPKKFIDIDNCKKDKNRIKTIIDEKLKKEYKQFLENYRIKIKLKVNK